MRCPKCGSRDDKVIDSRQSRDGSSIRRRRQCLKCKYRYTTYEEIERSDLRVIKTNRTHEPFDRRKLAASIAKAFEKRSASLLTLEDMVDEIVHELETGGRILFRYSDENGAVTNAANPNGSMESIAGICNDRFNVLGMMPHPERASERILGSSDGRVIFESLVTTLLVASK